MANKTLLPGHTQPLDNTPYWDCPEIPANELAISLLDPDFANKVNNCLHEWGFLLVSDIGKGLPALIDKVTKDWHAFFTSSEDKKNLWRYDPVTESGYVATSGSSLGKVVDKKEYTTVKPHHPKFSLPSDDFQDTVELILALEEIGMKILDAIEASCPVDIPLLKNLRKKVVKSENTLMRVNYFPPASPDDPQGQVPAEKHTDIGMLTILVPSNEPGLVLWDRTGKKWRVPYVPNALVINVGDILSILSGGTLHITGRGNYGNGKVYADGYYPSTYHGVDAVGERTADRMSIPLFIYTGEDEIIAETSDVRISADQAMKGGLANDVVIDAYRAMAMKGGLTSGIFRDIRLSNHGIGKKVEGAEGFDDKDC